MKRILKHIKFIVLSMRKVNLLLMRENQEVEKLSSSLGFDKTLFLERDFLLVKGINCKELLKQINKAKKKGLLVVAKVNDEKVLRFLLEKTAVDIVYGMESIHRKDSPHYPRSGVDQVIAKIAHEREKILAFSFSNILNCKSDIERAKYFGRIKYISKFCNKYNVETYFGNFSLKKEEMRSVEDLRSFWEFVNRV